MEIIDFMVGLARDAGREAMSYFEDDKHFTINAKGTPRDLVSTADKAVETLITGRIRAAYPDHGIYGEEFGKSGDATRYCWIIDPIDGTQCFIKHHPYFSISIGLYEQGAGLAGVVYAPALNRLFQAECGKGAWLNGKPIHASNCAKIETAAVATGFACLRAGAADNNLPAFNRIAPVVRDIKRCGSAALDLCHVACGTYDAYWERMLQPYDVAAGAVIAREAGATVCDFDGGADFPAKGTLACNGALLDQFLSYLRD